MEAGEIISAGDLAYDCLNLHYEEWDTLSREESDLPERIHAAGKSFRCENVRLETIDKNLEFEISEDKVAEYAARPNSAPPIVLNRDNRVIDGAHRLLAAFTRGDTLILACRPCRS